MPCRRVTTLRPVTLADAPALHALERAVIADGRGVVMGPSDLPGVDAYEGRMLGRLSDRGAWLVAQQDGRVVGQGAWRRFGPALLDHVAVLSVEVHPSAQGQGIGRLLCEELLRTAWAGGIERLELYVRADNERAIGLYRSLGFVREAVRTRFVRLEDGSYVDDWIMVAWRP